MEVFSFGAWSSTCSATMIDVEVISLIFLYKLLTVIAMAVRLSRHIISRVLLRCLFLLYTRGGLKTTMRGFF